MRTVNTSIEFNLGDAIAEKLSSGMTPSGEERLVRPGGRMGLMMDLMIERLITHENGSVRRTVDVSDLKPHRRAGL